MKNTKITILGDGGWGTTLAILLSDKGLDVTLWGAFEEYSAQLNKERVNTKFLPGIKIPRQIKITADLETAVCKAQVIIFASPSEYIRGVLRKIKLLDYPRQAKYVSVVKGIEINSLKRISEIIHEELPGIKVSVLSGPTIAHEVATGKPTTAVIASKDKKTAKYLQDLFMTGSFRIYTTNDIIGVELGGSLKNVIAIACGISDGLEFGANTKAALLSRGLAEISRLGHKMGAMVKTFSGVSGLGDLVTTCISSYSRNRFVGENIGKGKTLAQIKSHMQMVAEGVPTAKSAHLLSKKFKVDMPITEQVYLVLYKNKSAVKAVKDLMTREKKEE